MITEQEQNILRVIAFVCKFAPGEIMLLGGSMIHPEILGVRRARPPSLDIDFYTKKEGLERIHHLTEKHPKYGLPYTTIEGLTVGFYVGNIKGLEIDVKPVSVSTKFGIIYIIPPDLNAALKVRRGIQKKGEIYGKDIYDILAILSQEGSQFPEYMNRYVCPECNLRSKYGCIHEILNGKPTQSLPSEYQKGIQTLINSKDKISCIY
ncbi:MAG: hypothetical protein N3D75_01245 [Candidatus Aenigmarchaeota archaeon]|nr:hypothetical protein [Candidatus Aenigmarchaeota archaeon]